MNTILRRRAELDTLTANEIHIRLNIPLVCAKILVCRGIDSVEKAKRFLLPDSSSFYDPFMLSGMQECVQRIKEAVENQEKVVVFGDYDADGVSSTAMLSLFLQDLGLTVIPYIPNRHFEGYGISAAAVENIIEDIIPDLIITCDCGISAKNEIDTILDCGISVIVTDHHEPPEIIPDCTVINPKLKNQDYPFNALCGAGVVFKVIQAYLGLDEAMKYLDLACIASIADLVPLLDENRAIVSMGLKAISMPSANIGIRTMIRKLDLSKTLTASDVAFKLAPRINAAGRMGDAYRALNLFLAESQREADEVFDILNDENEKRKAVCQEVYTQAVELLRQTDYANTVPIILSHPDWEKGLTSIVAAQLANEFNRPTFLLVKSGETLKGTARSIEGINIYDALLQLSDILTEFGGHNLAAGFSLNECDLEEFRKRLNDYFLENYSYDNFVPVCSYDLDIDDKSITLKAAKELDVLEPYGFGFPRPVFMLSARGMTAEKMKSKPQHLSLKFPEFSISAFNYGGFQNIFETDSEFRLVFEMASNVYNNREYLNLTMRSLDYDFIGGVKNEDKLWLYYLNGITSTLNDDVALMPMGSEQFNKIINSKYRFGTLIVAYSFTTYSEILRRYPVLCEYCHSFLNRESSVNFNRVVLSPSSDFDTNGYGRIIFIDKPLLENKINLLPASNSECFIIDGAKSQKPYKLNITRDAFIECYKLFVHFQKSVFGARDIVSFISNMTNDLSLMTQLVASYHVFNELGILSFDPLSSILKINSNSKRELSESKIFQCLSKLFLGKGH